MIDNVGGGAGIFKTKYKNAAEEKKWFTTKIDSLVAPVYNAPILSGEIQEPV